MPGERNPQSAAKEFAPPPQGENVLDASMMAELIATKKEIAPQLKKSAGTSRARRKALARAVNNCRWRGDMGPSIRFFGSWVWGALLAAGSLPQFGRQLKGRSWRTRRRGHGSCKAIRKFGDTESASVAITLASTWLVRLQPFQSTLPVGGATELPICMRRQGHFR